MRKKFLTVFFILLFLLCLSVVSATDENTNSSIVAQDYDGNEFYVDLGGDDSNSGQLNSPFNSINKAVEVSNPRDNVVIHLGEGTFEGNGNVMISINKAHLSQGGSITIVGAGADKTIIKGSSAYYAFNIYADSVVTLRDLSIVDCKSVEGGAICNSGTLLVDKCIFRNNFAFNAGGAISSIENGDCKIYNSVFINNSVTCNDEYGNANGGAVYSLKSDLLVDSCRFVGNFAKGNCLNAISGGAIYVGAYLNNVPSVKNSNFINNYVVSTSFRTNWEYAKGGSIYMINCNLFNDSFINSSVTGNNGVGGSYYSEPKYLNSISNILRINSSVNGVLESNIYPADYDGKYSNEVVVYVSVNGNDENGNGSFNNPYATIANAIAKSAGNVYNLKVYLLDGVYSGAGNTNISLPSSMNIQIAGIGSKVIIDGSGSNWFAANERSISGFKYVLSNLTLINFKAKSTGYKKENNIGVISNYADLTIDNCIFKNIIGSSISNYDLANLKVISSSFVDSKHLGFYGGVLFNYDANARFYNCIVNNYSSTDIFYSTAVNTENVYLEFFNSTFKNLKSFDSRCKFLGASNTNVTMSYVNYADNDCNFAVAYDKSFVKIDNSVFKNSNWLSGSVNGMIWDVCNSSFININSLTFSSINDYKSNFNGCLFDGGNVEFRGNTITVGNSSFYNNKVIIVNNDNQKGNLDFNYNYWNNNNPKNMIDTTANVKLNYWIVKHLSAENLFNDSYKVVISYKLFDGSDYKDYDVRYVPVKPVRFILITSKGSNSLDSGILINDIFEFINTANDDRNVVVSFTDNTKLNITLYNQHKVDTNIDLSQKTAKIGDIVEINVNIKDNKTGLAVDFGIVEIYLNNKLISSNNVTGLAISKSITVDESKSFYNISVIYKGNNKYADSSNSAILRISSIPLETVIISKDLTKYYKNGSQFDVVLKDVLGNVLVGKIVKITINGVTYNKITNDKGEARLSINLFPGVYNITVLFEDDDNYVKSLNTNKIVVLSKIITKFVDNNKFIVKLVNDDGTPKTNASLAIIANGVQYNRITNGSGEARLNVRLNPNNYIFAVTDGQEVVSSSVNVLSTIETSDISMFYKDGTKYSVKLCDLDGNIMPNKNVAITINGVTYNKVTDSNGVAYLNINLNPGTYSVWATYGDKTVCNTVSISPMVVSMVSSSVNIQQGTFYKVKFSDALSNPIVGQEVGILINGIMYHRVTDELGVASIKINLNPGSYMVMSGLLSNAYEAKTINNVITVSGDYL
ncbi:MAG: adhesin [Methanobrevibacter smithii]